MCWVMPPASPATTLAWRIASSSDVLPWSTWPMIVTIGGRGNGSAFLVGRVEQALLDVGIGDALDRVAHFLGDKLGGVGVEHVGERDHAALAHQELDDVDRPLRHAGGELLDGDRLGKHDLARDLLLLVLHPAALEALGAAAERGDRTRALLFGRSRGRDRQAAAVSLLGAPRVGRGVGSITFCGRIGPRGGRLTTRGASVGRGAWRADGSGRRRRRSRRLGCGRRLGLRRPARRGRAAGGAGSPRQAAARLLLGLTLEGGFLGATGLLVALARFGGVAFGAFARLALAAHLGLGLLAAAVLFLAGARVEKRPGARFPLLGGQRRQDDAGLGRRRRARTRRRALAGGERNRRLGRRRRAGRPPAARLARARGPDA